MIKMDKHIVQMLSEYIYFV